MTVRIQSKNLYLTYLDKEEKIFSDSDLLEKLFKRLEDYSPYYGIACREVAPSTGTVHYHVLICCNKIVTTRKGKELLNIENILPHLERIRNNLAEIVKYIKKNGYFTEINPEQGPKKSWNNKKEKNELLLKGDIMKEFIEGNIGPVEVIRAEKIRTIFTKLEKPSNYKKKLVIWFKGPTGEGKTRTAIQIAEQYFDKDYWLSNDNLRWFDGYNRQKIAIIDDFRKSMLTDWNFLLRLLDGYNLIVQTKGGFTKWNPEAIIITSPATPEEAFQWVNKEGITETWDKQEQLLRRLEHDEELQVYDFPLWENELKRLENTIRRFIGLPEEEEEEWSIIEPEGFITPG